jgi:hypothetical protein
LVTMQSIDKTLSFPKWNFFLVLALLCSSLLWHA